MVLRRDRSLTLAARLLPVPRAALAPGHVQPVYRLDGSQSAFARSEGRAGTQEAEGTIMVASEGWTRLNKGFRRLSVLYSCGSLRSTTLIPFRLSLTTFFSCLHATYELISAAIGVGHLTLRKLKIGNQPNPEPAMSLFLIIRHCQENGVSLSPMLCRW